MINTNFPVSKKQYLIDLSNKLKLNLVNKTLNHIKETSSKVLLQVEKINQSIIGNYIFGCIKENTLECVGALAGASAGAHLVSYYNLENKAFKPMGENLGNAVGWTTAIALGILTGKVVYHLTKKTSQSPTKQLSESLAAGALTAAVTSTILPPNLAYVGAVAVNTLGTLIISQVGSTIGGFAAVYATGSEEPLVNFHQPHHSYSVKTLQSTLTCNLVNYFMNPNPFIGFFTDQMIGSLAYHSLTAIKPALIQIEQGTVLDHALYNAPTINADEKKLLKQFIDKTFDQSNDSYVRLSQQLAGTILAPFLTQDLQNLVVQLKSLVSTSIDSNSEQLLFAAITRTFNHYNQWVQNPLLREKYQNLNEQFIKSYQDSSQIQLLNEAQKELALALKNQAERELSGQLPDSIMQNSSMITQTEENQVNLFIEKILLKMKNLEEEVFVLSLTSPKLESYVKSLVTLHLPTFKLFLAKEMLQISQPLQESDIRKNYLFLNDLLRSYYLIAIDARFPIGAAFAAKSFVKLTHSFLDKQIETAKLSDSTLSDFVDLSSQP